MLLRSLLYLALHIAPAAKPQLRIAKALKRIQQDIAALRACAIDPMSIQLTDVIDIEIRPSSEDDRVLVGRKDWGYTVVNYTSEGLILDVFPAGVLTDPLVSASLPSTDLEAGDD